MVTKRTAVIIAVSVVAFLGALLGWLFLWQDNPNNKSSSEKPLFSFAALGDFGAQTNAQRTLETIARQRTAFTLALGDFSYGQLPEPEWCSFVTSRLGVDYPFELIAGNHDIERGEQGGGHIDRFSACLPNRMSGMSGTYGQQYYFDYDDIARFIAISPDLTINNRRYDYTPGSKDYQWLMHSIDDARAKGQRWIVVAMHHNCLAISFRCEIGQQLFNALIEKRVDIILQAHEHAYLRSKQLTTNEQCVAMQPEQFNAACVADDGTTYRAGNGPVLVINGTGGAQLGDLQPDHPNLAYFSDWHANNTEPAHGPTIITVWKNKLEGRFIDVDGNVLDSFTISYQE